MGPVVPPQKKTQKTALLGRISKGEQPEAPVKALAQTNIRQKKRTSRAIDVPRPENMVNICAADRTPHDTRRQCTDLTIARSCFSSRPEKPEKQT
jgi:hypothetical protein